MDIEEVAERDPNAIHREPVDGVLGVQPFQARQVAYALGLSGDAFKKCVDFIHLNLLDRWRIALLGTMDVILCRNVMIYFDADTRREVIATFEQKLRGGGHLLLGHSESLINMTSGLELRHLRSDLVYRKPTPGLAQPDPWHIAAIRAIGDAERSR